MVVGGLTVQFHGTRGSTPCEGNRFERYGGRTSCVELETPGEQPLLLDLGTGLKSFGEELPCAGYHADVLLTHLHWDHVQGLPFFRPLHLGAIGLDVHGPRQPDGALSDVFARFMGPPFFPVTAGELEALVAFYDIGDDDFALGGAKVRSRFVRHNGPTLGFRVEQAGRSVVYIPDHGPGCVPDDPDEYVPDAVLELCDGADLLIHDAQYFPEEFASYRLWGHSTVDYAVRVAAEGGAKRLVLFHHDPFHGDGDVDLVLRRAYDLAGRHNIDDVIAARDGLELRLSEASTA